jgi:hypothetical protein
MPIVFTKCLLHHIKLAFRTYSEIKKDMKVNNVKRHILTDVTIHTKGNSTIKYT